MGRGLGWGVLPAAGAWGQQWSLKWVTESERDPCFTCCLSLCNKVFPQTRGDGGLHCLESHLSFSPFNLREVEVVHPQICSGRRVSPNWSTSSGWCCHIPVMNGIWGHTSLDFWKKKKKRQTYLSSWACGSHKLSYEQNPKNLSFMRKKPFNCFHDCISLACHPPFTTHKAIYFIMMCCCYSPPPHKAGCQGKATLKGTFANDRHSWVIFMLLSTKP